MIEVQADNIKFLNFPTGPSSNRLYAFFRGRLIKSREGRVYKTKVEAWAKPYRQTIEKIKPLVKGKTLRVDYSFYFPKKYLLTKKNTVKKVDFTNFIKASQDALSDLLGVDDSYFVSGFFEKRVSDNGEAYIDITISAEKL